MNVSVSGYSGTYDGSAYSITVTAEDGATITYAESKNGSYSGTNPSYKNAGTHTVYYKVTKTGSTEVTGSQNVAISQKPVTVSGITATGKPYDGNTEATLVYSDVVIDGKVNGDDLSVTATGTFENAEVGENKKVTISGLTLGGESAGNYVLAESG